MVCYFGSGIPMTAPAGSMVVFSSVVIHRSGPNRTDRNRRVYLAQYSKEIIPSKDGTGAHGSFDPFLKAGQIVADR
jgi:ectoine hydroxylase-related dioxygenase (phytanoyl-CoA dioxygenase family)